jgi:glycosyltransferase involved in cell wall biosynthesis
VPDQVRDYIEPLLNVVWIAQQQRGAAAARNRGASSARGLILAFLDDDCIPRSDWLPRLQALVGCDRSDNVVAVGGRVLPLRLHGSIVGRFLAYTQHLDGPIVIDGEICNMAAANLAVSREAFERVGGFDERFVCGAEDQNLLYRMRRHGRFVFDPMLVVSHDHDISVVTMCQKYWRYGKGVALHMMLTETTPKEADMYMVYCHQWRDLWNRAALLRSRASEFLRSYGFPRGLPATTRAQYTLLALAREIAFQAGAVAEWKGRPVANGGH